MTYGRQNTRILLVIMLCPLIPGCISVVGADDAVQTGTTGSRSDDWAEVSIEMDGYSREATAEPNRNNMAIFTGTVYAIVYDWDSEADNYTLQLEAGSAHGWRTRFISPPDGLAEAHDHITLRVDVPDRTSSTVTDVVTLGGHLTDITNNRTLEIPNETLTVTIRPYTRYDLDARDQWKKVRGGSMEYIVYVHNEGNYDATFTIDGGNVEDLRKDGLKVDISEDTLIVPENSTGRVTVVMEDSMSTSSGLYSLQLTVSTPVHGEDYPYEEDIFLYYELPWLTYTDIGLIVGLTLVLTAVVLVMVRRRRKKGRGKRED